MLMCLHTSHYLYRYAFLLQTMESIITILVYGCVTYLGRFLFWQPRSHWCVRFRCAVLFSLFFEKYRYCAVHDREAWVFVILFVTFSPSYSGKTNWLFLTLSVSFSPSYSDRLVIHSPLMNPLWVSSRAGTKVWSF